jgi:hypothetical protein
MNKKDCDSEKYQIVCKEKNVKLSRNTSMYHHRVLKSCVYDKSQCVNANSSCAYPKDHSCTADLDFTLQNTVMS